MSNAIRVCLIGAFFIASNTLAFDKNGPSHDHQGMLKPYQKEPPELVLTQAQQDRLNADEAIYIRQSIANAERGVAVFRVDASVQSIWSVIRDFRSYPDWIDDIERVEIYHQRDDFIYVRFTAEGVFDKSTWYVEHEYPRSDRNWGSWRLDYDFRSDIDDSVGYWRVTPMQGEEQVSVVVYSADLRLGGFIGSLFEKSLIDKNLKDASSWVKREAELLTINH